ncbi:MAG: peptidyl-prolyl cis-trans isomerase [Burkholderiales bacterium]|nr:peptidyl-prolyl cis-trans isomerase [Burkholderiales bacterium]
MKRLLHEPLLHFVLLGALLFGLYSLWPAGRDRPASSHEIRLSLDELNQLVQLFQSQWRRPPTPQELRQLVENKVQQEVLYREALALGLDKDDEIVKRRMAQKMQFLAEDVAAAREPSADELRRWFDARRERFAQPPRLSLRHLYFSTDRRGARAQADAQAALERLAGQPQDAPLAATLADAFMFQDHYRDRTPEFLAKEFGPAFAQAVARLPPGTWQGPVASGLGWHLVFVDTVVPGRVPAFEAVEGEVKQAWLAEQKAQAWRKAYQDLRAKYTVLLPGPPEAAAPKAADPR